MYRLDTDLAAWLPDYYADIADYQQITGAETQEFETLETALFTVLDNFDYTLMDAATLTAWENLLGISASSSDSLEFRRNRIVNRISTRPPFTLRFLKNRLDELIGVGQWAVYVDYGNYTITIYTLELDAQLEAEVAQTVRKITPAHMVINYANASDVAAARHSGTMTSISGISEEGGIIA